MQKKSWAVEQRKTRWAVEPGNEVNDQKESLSSSAQQDGVRDTRPCQSSQDPSTRGEPSISLSSSQVEELERSEEESAMLAELEGSWDSGGGVSDFMSVSELQQRTLSVGETASYASRLTERTRKRPHPADF